VNEEEEYVEEAPKPQTKKARRSKRAGKVRFGGVARFPRERFLEFCKVLKIQSRDYGLVTFELLGSQLYILDEICSGLAEGITTFIILKARQLGASTFFLALDLFWAMEYDGLLGVFACHEEGARDQFRNQIDVFFQTIPKTHKVGCSQSNRTMLVLENNSLFRYLIAGTRGSTNKLGRSGGCNFLHSTETAFYGSEDDISALNQTLSEIYPHRLYIYESTANGFNHFEEMWETAISSPAQKAIFVPWWRNELYEFGKGHPLYLKYMPQGVNTGLTTEERKMVKEVRERFGYQLTAGQMAWWRHHLETKCNNDLAQMFQEMPHTPEAAFVATGSQFFTNEAVTIEMREAKKLKCMPFVFKFTKSPGDTMMMSSTIQKAELKIWEEPVGWGKYVIGCDSAFGRDEKGDNTVITVDRCFADCCVQVAEFSSAATEPHECAWLIAYLAGLYSDVMVILEMNNSGNAVDGELRRLRTLMRGVATSDEMSLKNCIKYMRDYLYRREDSLAGGLLRQWVTTPNNKPHLFERYKIGFETGRVKIRSMAALEEHRKIVRDEGSIGGSGRSKDDRVFANALAYYAWDQWIRPVMSGQGRTYEKERQIEKQGGPDVVNVLMQKFFQMKRIKVPDQSEA
jgi:hypothetical protein